MVSTEYKWVSVYVNIVDTGRSNILHCSWQVIKMLNIFTPYNTVLWIVSAVKLNQQGIFASSENLTKLSGQPSTSW